MTFYKRGLGLAILLSGAFLATGCENVTTRATEERLATLRDSGLEADAQAKADERLAKTLNKENATGALADRFGNVAANSGTTQPVNTLVAAALERNPRIGRAAQNINRKDAERLNAIFGYLPQVSIRYEQEEIDQNVIQSDNAVFALGQAQYPATSLTAELRQPLFDLSRIFGIQFANNARSQAEVEYVKSVRDVVYEVLDSYLVAGQAQTRVEALSQRGRIVGAQVRSQEALEEEGLDIDSEVASLRSEQASISAERAIEQTRYVSAIGTLSRLTGTTVTRLQRLQVPRGVTGTERRVSPDNAVARGLENNPGIMIAALEVVGTEISRRRAIAADFSPVIEAYALLEQSDREASRFGGGSETEDQTVGVRITVPLFNSQGSGYATLPATVDVRSAALDYYAQRAQLETEIRAVHARMAQISNAVGQTGSAVAAARRALGAERRRVDAGESVDLAVAARQLRVNAAQERQQFQQVEYLRAWARLQYLMGADLSGQRL